MSVFVTIVFALLLNLGFVFLRHRRRRIQASKRGSREEVYLGLRNLALRSSREQSNLAPTSSTKEPWGVLMDWGVGDGTATAVALSNGHASIYLSSGGGYLGGAQSHDSVRNAAKKMVAAAVETQPQTLAAKEFPLPPTGKV